MTKAQWDMVLCGEWTGQKIETGDKIVVFYRCNWHRGRARAYKKLDTRYAGVVLDIDENFIRFENDKRLSYKSISGISRVAGV